jgi:hypothetical protein
MSSQRSSLSSKPLAPLKVLSPQPTVEAAIKALRDGATSKKRVQR